MQQTHIQIRKHIGRLSELLKAGGRFFATAESCTGGLVAALCTDVPGSSAWFSGGVVAYANCVKSALLGVDARVIASCGAVSEDVARAMALGALERLEADCCLAISGVAGPDGGTAEKPVGTVWLAVARRPDALYPGRDKDAIQVRAERHLFPGDRNSVRLAAAREGLALAVKVMEERG